MKEVVILMKEDGTYEILKKSKGIQLRILSEEHILSDCMWIGKGGE